MPRSAGGLSESEAAREDAPTELEQLYDAELRRLRESRSALDRIGQPRLAVEAEDYLYLPTTSYQQSLFEMLRNENRHMRSGWREELAGYGARVLVDQDAQAFIVRHFLGTTFSQLPLHPQYEFSDAEQILWTFYRLWEAEDIGREGRPDSSLSFLQHAIQYKSALSDLIWGKDKVLFAQRHARELFRAVFPQNLIVEIAQELQHDAQTPLRALNNDELWMLIARPQPRRKEAYLDVGLKWEVFPHTAQFLDLLAERDIARDAFLQIGVLHPPQVHQRVQAGVPGSISRFFTKRELRGIDKRNGYEQVLNLHQALTEIGEIRAYADGLERAGGREEEALEARAKERVLARLVAGTLPEIEQRLVGSTLSLAATARLTSKAIFDRVLDTTSMQQRVADGSERVAETHAEARRAAARIQEDS